MHTHYGLTSGEFSFASKIPAAVFVNVKLKRSKTHAKQRLFTVCPACGSC